MGGDFAELHRPGKGFTKPFPESRAQMKRAFSAVASIPVLVAGNDLVGSIAMVGGRSMQPTLNPGMNG